MLSAARLPQVRAEACISANWERNKVRRTVRTMFGELKVQLRNESYFVELSEVWTDCSLLCWFVILCWLKMSASINAGFDDWNLCSTLSVKWASWPNYDNDILWSGAKCIKHLDTPQRGWNWFVTSTMYARIVALHGECRYPTEPPFTTSTQLGTADTEVNVLSAE